MIGRILQDHLLNSVMTMNYYNYTFTIYRHSPKIVKITGLKSGIGLEKQKIFVEETLKQNVVKVRIDNILFFKKDFILILYSNMLRESKITF